MGGLYFDRVDAAGLARAFPFRDDFTRHFQRLSRDALRAGQERAFQKLMRRAWTVPFYADRYRAAGIEPGDIHGLDDLPKLPTFSKADLMASLARHPPFGDFHGAEIGKQTMVLHTTSGTTGQPQILLFGPESREIQNLLLARVYYFQGLRDTDVVHSVYGFGMINGGHFVREALLHWTRALLLPAGTGNETPSRQQVQLMQQFGATCLVGFADYIKRLAEIAVETGLRPGREIPIRLISGHLGREDRSALSELWGGATVYDWYGVGDTGVIAAEGPDQDGLYVMEDAQFVELLDVDSGRSVGAGEAGDLVVTVLFKDDIYPIIRFNTHDVSAVLPGTSSLGLNLTRIKGFLGRSDNMIKWKGINLFPQAIGPILARHASFQGEYLCEISRLADGREHFSISIEVAQEDLNDATTVAAFQTLLRDHLAVDVPVSLTARGTLAPHTGIEKRQKPIRLIDHRD